MKFGEFPNKQQIPEKNPCVIMVPCAKSMLPTRELPVLIDADVLRDLPLIKNGLRIDATGRVRCTFTPGAQPTTQLARVIAFRFCGMDMRGGGRKIFYKDNNPQNLTKDNIEVRSVHLTKKEIDAMCKVQKKKEEPRYIDYL